MKKPIAFLLALCLMASLCSCAGDARETNPPELEIHEDNIAAALFHKAPTLFITVSENGDLFDLDVSLDTHGKVSNFGNYVIEIKNAFEQEFAAENRGSFSVSLPIDGTNPTMIRFSSDLYSEMTTDLSGTLYDNRSGKLVFHDISDIDALCEFFPATTKATR